MGIGKTVCSRIRNARASLDNAERSFRDNRSVRGELDLMLAEAELQNIRQNRPGWVSWTRQTFAALAAVVILAAGGLGWWWASSTNPAVNAGYGSDAHAAAAPVAETAGTRSTVPAAGTGTYAAETVSRENGAGKADRAGRPDSGTGIRQEEAGPRPERVKLSNTRMQQLIRSGRQELSGY